MILVCGEALIDFFPSGAFCAEVASSSAEQNVEDKRPWSMMRSFDFSGRFGGSPFNVAFGIARLGVPSAYFGCLSTDFFGEALASFLAREGVDLSFVRRSGQPTTLAFVQTAPDGTPTYAFCGEAAADRMLTASDLPIALPGSITALSFGSFSLAVEPCGTAFETLLLQEALRRVVALDPNVRARLVSDKDTYRQRLERLIGAAAIIKVSTEDMQALYGPGNPYEIARTWNRQEKGQPRAKLIVITDGANGAQALLEGEWITFPATPVPIADTVGAGDTVQAALLAGLHTRNLLTHSALNRLTCDQAAPVIAQAITAATFTCTRRGADLPHTADFNFS